MYSASKKARYFNKIKLEKGGELLRFKERRIKAGLKGLFITILFGISLFSVLTDQVFAASLKSDAGIEITVKGTLPSTSDEPKLPNTSTSKSTILPQTNETPNIFPIIGGILVATVLVYSLKRGATVDEKQV